MTLNADRHVFFLGDSFVVGVGDPEHRGWVGRLAELSREDGALITAYNLGVRRDTSEDVRRRWFDEVGARRAASAEERMVVAFGVNDTALERGRPRVEPGRSEANLHSLIDGARTVDLPLLVVGPAPVEDPRQNERIAVLDDRFRAACTVAEVPYVAVHAALAAEPLWTLEVERGDGSHPGAGGYALLAGLVLPAWRRWLSAGQCP
ncbi:MAG: lipolytic protein family [Pseudonocardia sp.]|nr:lipolytic protein family [Pseudonocardia sp.]